MNDYKVIFNFTYSLISDSSFSLMEVAWFVGWVLWHINPCRSFNAKSCLYSDISNIYDL